MMVRPEVIQKSIRSGLERPAHCQDMHSQNLRKYLVDALINADQHELENLCAYAILSPKQAGDCLALLLRNAFDEYCIEHAADIIERYSLNQKDPDQ